MNDIPPSFARTICDLYPEEGPAWLAGLPALLDLLAARWSLRMKPPFSLSYNYVAPVLLADGSEAVLKLAPPNPEQRGEIAALRWYDGRGCVRLLAADEASGAFLLARLRPGHTLVALEDDEEATRIAAGVMQALWRPLPAEHPFRPVGEWAAGLGRLRERFDGGTGPLPTEMVDMAEGLFEELSASAAAPVLLHGDLHHENILNAGVDSWLAIDPKGVAGEPAYEIGALLRNPFPHLLTWPDLERVLARRLDILAEMLDFDRQRLLAWSAAQAVLSGWWSLEDHGRGWEWPLAVAERLAGLMG